MPYNISPSLVTVVVVVVVKDHKHVTFHNVLACVIRYCQDQTPYYRRARMQPRFTAARESASQLASGA